MRQIIQQPTHKHGHILDWLIVREDASPPPCQVLDLALADHKAIICDIPFQRPHRPKRLVTSRSLKKMNTIKFQEDIKSFTNGLDSCSVKTFDTSLRQILDNHAPLVTRHITDRPSAPWMTEEIQHSKRRKRQAERKWRTSKLTVHHDIYVQERNRHNRLQNRIKAQFFATKIGLCSTTRQLHSIANQLLGKRKDQICRTIFL